MEYKVRGTVMQVLDLKLNDGESVYTEKGGMSWMSPNITMQTNAKGGVLKGVGRLFSGESFFMTTYTSSGGPAELAFSSEFPGKILPMTLSEGKNIICQRDSFMVAEETVNLSVAFQKKLGAAIFGGEGFILQKLSGTGTAFLEVAGELTEYDLKPGQTLKVDPGHIAFFEESVKYNIGRIKGLKNMVFGGEGIFLADLEGPGKVWLQSMPLSKLAQKLSQYMIKAKTSMFNR
ncbi:MAG: TIGR00266 family protein [Nanohaloarchaea archaeon]|nr:TIGR00266 family protein [Candidatus Nanohaloarchaea archaeon]